MVQDPKYPNHLLNIIWYEAINNLQSEIEYPSALLKILPVNYHPGNLLIFLGAMGFSDMAPPLRAWRPKAEAFKGEKGCLAGLFSVIFILIALFGLIASIRMVESIKDPHDGTVILSLFILFVITIFLGVPTIAWEIPDYSMRHRLFRQIRDEAHPIEKVKILERLPKFLHSYFYKKRPTAQELESALQEIQEIREMAGLKTTLWARPLSKLAQKKAQPKPINHLINALGSAGWRNRFVARHTLIAIGVAAVPLLQKKLTRNPDLADTITWLLKNISRQTTAQLSKKYATLLCSDCLVAGHKHRIALSKYRFINIYGCRTCFQSQNFLEKPERIAVILDADFRLRADQANSMRRVHWLEHKMLFDFDMVEITKATDKEVERFVVQVGNDTDQTRKKRYSRIDCIIGPDCNLSENTIRILQNTFGQVKNRPPGSLSTPH